MTQQIFWSSDPHYGHKNVIKYANRPFKNVYEMNEALIDNWNSVVTSKDIVYALGDMFFTTEREAINIVRRLNGQIHWIFGNHDTKARKWKELISMFAWTGEVKDVRIKDPDGEYRREQLTESKRYNKIRMFHEPIASWIGMHKGAWHLHGHSHGSYNIPYGKILDVGVDSWNYTPVSYDQIKEYMKTRVFRAVDGHDLAKGTTK